MLKLAKEPEQANATENEDGTGRTRLSTGEVLDWLNLPLLCRTLVPASV